MALTIASPAALVWTLVALLAIRPQGDLDYWWHVRIGEWIVGHVEIPRTALLTWLSSSPWTAHEWASEVILYELNQATGPFGSIALFGSVTIAIFIVMASVMRLLRPTMSALSIAIFGLVAAFAATAIWLPRAQLFDILFSLAALRIALGYLERGERRGLWLMPLVMVAWVNLHGGGGDDVPAGDGGDRRGRMVEPPDRIPARPARGGRCSCPSGRPSWRRAV